MKNVLVWRLRVYAHLIYEEGLEVICIEGCEL